MKEEGEGGEIVGNGQGADDEDGEIEDLEYTDDEVSFFLIDASQLI